MAAELDLSRLLAVPDAKERQALKGLLATIPVGVVETFSLGAAALAVADYLVKAATSTELPNNTTKTYTVANDNASPMDGGAAAPAAVLINDAATTVWDVRDGATYGRNLEVAATHSSSLVAMTIVVTGYDWIGQAMTESFSISATGTSKSAVGKKMFAYVASIAITSAGNATTNTLNVGTGSAISPPYRLEKIGHLAATSIGGVQELINVASNATVVAAVSSTASATTGDVRGSITFTTALDGSKEAFVHYHVSGRWTKPQALHGVTQA